MNFNNIKQDVILAAWDTFHEHLIAIVKIIFLINFPILIINSIFTQINLKFGSAIIVKMFMTKCLEEFFYVVTGIVITVFAYQAANGCTISLGDLIEKSFYQIKIHFWTLTLGLVIVVAALMLLIVPGIIAGTYFSFAVFTVILRHKTCYDALIYAQTLIKKRWATIFSGTIFLTLCWCLIKILIYLFFGICMGAVTHLGSSSAWQLIISNLSDFIGLICTYFVLILYMFFFLTLERNLIGK